MNMNRPSLYNAFGSKEELYRQAFAHFTAGLDKAMSAILCAEPDLEKALMRFYSAAIDEYLAADPPRGCFVFCTAPVETVSHPAVASDIRAVLARVDRTLIRKFAEARNCGELSAAFDCVAAGKLAQAILHSIALRARAGEPRRSLLRLARSGVALLARG